MKRPTNLDAVRRRNLRRSMEVRKGMPCSLPDDTGLIDSSTMQVGEGVQGTVTFDAELVDREQTALQYADGSTTDESGLVVVLSRCTIETSNGNPFDSDAVVHIGGALARDLATRSKCLAQRAFLIHGRLVKRSGAPRNYDLTAFSGTSPRKGMQV